jgi:hypothetical protein
MVSLAGRRPPIDEFRRVALCPLTRERCPVKKTLLCVVLLVVSGFLAFAPSQAQANPLRSWGWNGYYSPNVAYYYTPGSVSYYYSPTMGYSPGYTSYYYSPGTTTYYYGPTYGTYYSPYYGGYYTYPYSTGYYWRYY